MKRTNYILFTSLIFGLLLWLGLFTDYSFSNLWANISVPPLIGLISFVIWRKTRKFTENATKNWLAFRRLACILPMIGGLPYLFLMIIVWIPPLTLGTMFWMSEQYHAILIQKEVSPDGTKVGEVYLLPVGAYSGGNGRIEVHLKHTWLPIIKRDIYYQRVSRADESATDYLQWIDDETIYIKEDKRQLDVSTVNFDLPAIILLPLNLLRFFS